MIHKTRCIKCGRLIVDDQVATYQQVFSMENGRWIGNRCHPDCLPGPSSENDRMCLQLINFLELDPQIQLNHEQLTRLAELLISTTNMRQVQIAYFKTRDPSLVAGAKKLEKHVDQLLKFVEEHKLPPDANQPPLFNIEKQ